MLSLGALVGLGFVYSSGNLGLIGFALVLVAFDGTAGTVSVMNSRRTPAFAASPTVAGVT